MSRSQTQVLTTIFEYFKSDFSTNITAQTYLKSLGLDINKLKDLNIEFGFNSGQFQLDRKLPFTQEDYLHTGLIQATLRNGYKLFGNHSIIFPLKDVDNQIVNLYAIIPPPLKLIDSYLNRQGMFPCYPSTTAQSLFITDSILEACFLIQKNPRQDILAIDKFKITNELKLTLKSLSLLKEIILTESKPNTVDLFEIRLDFRIAFTNLRIEMDFK
jgi:hypothetical protein